MGKDVQKLGEQGRRQLEPFASDVATFALQLVVDQSFRVLRVSHQPKRQQAYLERAACLRGDDSLPRITRNANFVVAFALEQVNALRRFVGPPCVQLLSPSERSV